MCSEGNTDTCSAFNLPNTADPNFVNVRAFNQASIQTRGFDIEASYQRKRPLGLDGNVTLRGLGTLVIEFVTDSGLTGVKPVDSAGANSGATPSWKWLAMQTFENEDFSLLLQERRFSDGVYGNQYVVCAPGTCPRSTTTIRRSTSTG